MRIAIAALCGLLLIAPVAGAAQPDLPTVKLVLKDHRFTPATLEVPAGRKVRIVLENQDGATEELDSEDLGGVEELVTPHATVRFEIGPLKPGRYAFMGELHAKTAHGVVVVK